MAVNKIMINKATGTEVLMDLTSDTVTAETLTNGYTAHDKSGKVVTGTNPYAKSATDATVNTQADLIAQIATALEGKAAGGGGGGATVELVEGEVACEGFGPQSDNMQVYYTGEDMTMHNVSIGIDERVTFQALKNTIVCVTDFPDQSVVHGVADENILSRSSACTAIIAVDSGFYIYG